MVNCLTAQRGEMLTPGGHSSCLNGPGNVTACLILNSSITLNSAWGKSLLLGRPWGSLAQTVLRDTYIGAGLEAAGWDDWSHNCETTGWCNQTCYAENNSRGPGANPAGRVKWAHTLSDAQGATWTVDSVLRGWSPMGADAVATMEHLRMQQRAATTVMWE